MHINLAPTAPENLTPVKHVTFKEHRETLLISGISVRAPPNLLHEASKLKGFSIEKLLAQLAFTLGNDTKEPHPMGIPRPTPLDIAKGNTLQESN